MFTTLTSGLSPSHSLLISVTPDDQSLLVFTVPSAGTIPHVTLMLRFSPRMQQLRAENLLHPGSRVQVT